MSIELVTDKDTITVVRKNGVRDLYTENDFPAKITKVFDCVEKTYELIINPRGFEMKLVNFKALNSNGKTSKKEY